MSLRFALEARAFRLLLRVARVLPRPVLLTIGSALGALTGLLDVRHRRIAVANLLDSFAPQLDRAAARRLARDCFRHFGRITLDTLYFQRLDRKQIDGLVRIHGVEHLRTAQAQGKGILLFSGHFGHWELAGVTSGFLGARLAVVARPLDNPALERMLGELRACSGNLVVYKRNAVREMLRALHRGMGVAILLDQDARREGIFVPFFGRAASTTPTLALLALRSGAPIIPTFAVVRHDHTCDLTFEPPLPIEKSGDRGRDVRQITERCTVILESWIRRYPDQWLWMHRRWKTAPPARAADALPCGASAEPEHER